MTNEVPTTSVDPTSAAALAERGLRLQVVVGEADPIEDFNFAVARGFLESRGAADGRQFRYDRFFERRNSGVFDDIAAEPHIPVGTINSWITDLTVPGRASVRSLAISAVTVAPTHRRRGIASALIGAELRTAHALGVPVAMLTVSETTIYGRFGFGPSAMSVDLSLDTARARWIGPEPAGRIHFVSSERMRDVEGEPLFERVRLDYPGMIDYRGQHLWFRQFGIPGKPDFDAYRVIRYDDANGIAQGYAIYRVDEKDDGHVADVHYLVAATDDAYAALWRFLLEMDLITTVTAKLRPLDEPVYWQVWDKRAVERSGEREHLWTRILDPKVALESRTYAAPGIFALEVTDDLGFAAGSWILDAASQTVHEGAIPVGAHHLRLAAAELGSIYLGGVSVATLVHAGLIEEVSAGAAEAADAAFRSPVTPWSSIWF